MNGLQFAMPSVARQGRRDAASGLVRRPSLPIVDALDGLRVLELGGEIAAPYATKLLAELGADVLKIEPPDGVPNRDPVQVGARIHEYTAGSFAAAAALTAVRAARRNAEPVTVDLSTMECLVGTLAYPMIVMDDMLAAGVPPPSARHFPLP